MNPTIEKLIQGYRHQAISLFFVVLMLVIFSGCAMKQDVMRVEEKVNQIKNDQMLLRAKIDHIDSLTVASLEQNNNVRVEVRSTLGEVSTALEQIKIQMDDLQQVIFRLSQKADQPQATLPPPVVISPDSSLEPGTTTTADVSGQPSVDCRKLWDNSFKDMYRGQHDLAIAGFYDYLKFCPDGHYADNCQYWIAEAYYEMKQFPRAMEEYQKLLDNYPESGKRATAFFKLGRCSEESGDNKKALEYFLILQNDYPGSVEHEQVRDKIALMQEGQ